MTFRANPRVTIGGTDFTSHAIGRVTVNKGRRTVYERPNAGFATAELIDVDGIPTFRVGQTFVVNIDRADFLWAEMQDAWADVGDTWDECVEVQFVSQPVFTGTLSDFTSSAIPAKDGPIITHQLQAVGPLATLNRRAIYADGRISEDDGDRILNILTTALGTALVNPSVIDPGVFDLSAVGTSDVGFNALQLAQDAGFSGEGLLFETSDGFIGYTDANRRLENERARVIQAPFGILSSDGISILQQLADITNAVTVTFEGGGVSEEDEDSITQFGRFETEIRTDLVNLSNAENRAREFLQRHAIPSSVFDQLQFNLLGVPDELRNELLELRTSEAIRVSGIPSRVGFTEFRGFVEGFTLTMDPFSADLTFVVSERRLSIGAQRWQQVIGTIAWQDVDPALTWNNAIEVTT